MFQPTKFISFFSECRRVLQITKRPDKDMYLRASIISGTGIFIIGSIGFIVTILWRLFV